MSPAPEHPACPRCGSTLQAGVLDGHCPRCLLEAGVDSQDETQPVSDRPKQVAGVETTPLDRGRFVAGTVLSGRYRIVGLLGRGGMGEVYKAEDLKLRQLVALKFLPDAFSNDGPMLARFHREVRTARYITHPNVCRVHDIGETVVRRQAVHFLSMEYIDGEDLAGLLRRIGHLPHQKSIELARQLCSGLAAAHDAGMVHRDLKPANVMLDGRGRARITDFGLADFAAELKAGERSGTPAYMAPEQLRGEPATTASDIYALGLVLYEIFTGHRAFEAATLGDLIDQQERGSIRPPSSRLAGIDPLVERVILRCLESKPAQRPRSAFDVAAALPGGDPLAAALAAGVTPSPEMVAASGRKTGLSPRTAWTLLSGTLSVLFLTAVLFNPAADRSAALANSPEVLADTARGVLSHVGFREPPIDTAYGFAVADDVVESGHPDMQQRGWARFWYRESPETLVPSFLHPIGPFYAVPGFRVTHTDPPPVRPNMRSVVLDSERRLLGFSVVPALDAPPAGAAFDWTPFLALAGLNPDTLSPAQPEIPASTDTDTREAWTGTWPGLPNIPLRVEAGSWRGQPVFFKLSGPWSVQQRARESVGRDVLTAMTIAVVFGGMVVCALLARRNIRAGRGDRRGAFNIALFAFFTLMLAWLFGSDHKLDPRELNLYLSALGESLYWSAIVGIAYLALEPIVRQKWPHALISWNRVLKGRFRDPLVGRDVLIGVAFAAALSVSRTAALLLDLSPPQLPEPNVLQAMHSNSQTVAFLLGIIFDSMNMPLVLFLLFSFSRSYLRNQWIAGLVWICLINLFVNLPEPEWSGVLVGTLFAVLWLAAVLRFGLISGMAMWFADRVFRAEIMIAPGNWYAGRMYLLIGAVAALSVFACVTSLRNQTADAVH